MKKRNFIAATYYFFFFVNSNWGKMQPTKKQKKKIWKNITWKIGMSQRNKRSTGESMSFKKICTFILYFVITQKNEILYIICLNIVYIWAKQGKQINRKFGK